MLRTLVLLAADDQQGGPPGGSLLWILWPVAAVFLIYHFLIGRPQSRERRTRQQMLQALKPNDRVVTIGGIYGVVSIVHRDQDTVTLKVDESNNTRIRVSMAAIARIVGDEPSKETPSKKD
jgi:preprotein translocase subunit YajC